MAKINLPDMVVYSLCCFFGESCQNSFPFLVSLSFKEVLFHNRMKKDTYHSQPSSGQSSKSSSAFVDDPFLVFESSSANPSSWPFFDPLEEQTGKGSVQSPIDDLEKFAMGKVRDDANDKQGASMSKNIKISIRNRDGHKAHLRKVKINDYTLHQKQEEKIKERRERLTREKETSVNGNDLDDIFGLGSESRNLSSSTTEVRPQSYELVLVYSSLSAESN